MFIKKLNLFFLTVTILGSVFLVYNWYQNYQFKNNPLSEKIMQKIYQKHRYLETLSYQKFGIKRKIPVKISDTMPSKLFGAATYSMDGKIVVFLNKKRFQESVNYMIDDVLPHEYAHAIMFVKGDFSDKFGGHTKKWQNICIALEGQRCDRFVNHKDIIIGKTDFLY